MPIATISNGHFTLLKGNYITMRLLPTLTLAVTLLTGSTGWTFAQRSSADSAFLRNSAFLYADSMTKAYQNSQWENYCRFSHEGIIRYLGGQPRYISYSQRAGDYPPNERAMGVNVVQLVNESNRWQAVVERIRDIVIDGKRARVTAYMIGLSDEGGETWKFFEVFEGLLENARRIVPEISDKIRIPQRRIIYLDDPEPLMEPVVGKN